MSVFKAILAAVVMSALVAALRGIVHPVLRGLFDGLLFPFRGLHPLVGLAVLSVPVSIGMLLVFKATSDQERIAAIKAQIQAGLFEIRLFNDDLRAIFRAQGEILAQNARYVGNSLVPLFWVIVPFILIIGQLQYQYGYRGLVPGEAALVKVKLAPGEQDGGRAAAPGNPGRPGIRLEVPPGLRVATPAVWLPSLQEIDWRVVADEWGDYEIAVRLGDESYAKSVRVSDAVARRSPVRIAAGVLGELRYPAEAPLPKGSPLASITVTYPESGPVVFDLSVWVWAFFGISIVLAFALRGRFGVTI